jgi:hypothetical protein
MGDLSTPTGTEGNAAALEAVRRRYRRTVFLFYFFIALMPLGCVGPCGLAMVIPNETARAVFGMTGLLLPFVGLGGMLLMLGDRSRYKRSLTVAEQADRMGLSFTEVPAKAEYARLRQLPVFDEATKDDARNLVTGQLGGVALLAADYSYAIGTGRYANASTQTVLALPGAAEGLPRFLLVPRRWTDRLAKLLGGRAIELPGRPEFNKQFTLGGLNAAAIAACFTQEAVQLCLEGKDLTAQTGEGMLVVHRENQFVDPAEYERLAAWAARLARALRPAK